MKNTLNKPAKALGVLGAAVASLAVFTSAESHHSFAMYDQTTDVTLTGRLTRFIPGGNHAQLLFQRIDENGERLINENGDPDIWGVETAPSATIAREGITVESFPIGTVLTVTINPLRNGKPFGALSRGSSIVKCGDALPEGGCNEETGQAFLGLRE
jgi:hypothetical protein